MSVRNDFTEAFHRTVTEGKLSRSQAVQAAQEIIRLFTTSGEWVEEQSVAAAIARAIGMHPWEVGELASKVMARMPGRTNSPLRTDGDIISLLMAG